MEIKGRVIDFTGEPLMGANMTYLKSDGTRLGTATNENGEFFLEVDALQPITISYIGFTTKKALAKDINNTDVVLNENIEQLGEVVITAKKPVSRKKINNLKTYAIIGVGASLLATVLLFFKYKK